MSSPQPKIIATSVSMDTTRPYPITNWTKNPRNCNTMFKLLGDCLNKSETTKPCSRYHSLLVQCHK